MTIEEIKSVDDVAIKTKYIPIALKMLECDLIIKSAYYTTMKIGDIEKKIFRQNTVAKRVLLNMMLIDKYTNIEFDKARVFDEYDKLMERELMLPIIEKIPESEILEFHDIMESMIHDIFVNERDLVSYIDNKLEALNLSLDDMITSLAKK